MSVKSQQSMYMCSAVLIFMNILSFQNGDFERKRERTNELLPAKCKMETASVFSALCRLTKNFNTRFFYDLMQFMKWSSQIISVKYGSIDRYILTFIASFVWILDSKFRLETSFLLDADFGMAYRLIFCVLSVVYPMPWLPCYR